MPGNGENCATAGEAAAATAKSVMATRKIRIGHLEEVGSPNTDGAQPAMLPSALRGRPLEQACTPQPAHLRT